LEQEWGGPSAVTEAERATFFLNRWREATSRADAAAAAAFRAAIEHHDSEGRHKPELLGRGSLQIDVTPPGATVHLFRYESYETVRADDVIPRLVPVPTRGVGRAHEGAYGDGFVPGDPCLCIVDVKPGSPADALGVRPGDLVVGIECSPCGSGLFVREVREGTLQAAGVTPYARVASLNDRSVEDSFDWLLTPRSGNQDRIVFAPGAREVVTPRETVKVARATELAAGFGPADLHLQCLCHGKPLELVVPAGQGSGLTTEVTAYPLLCSAGNLVSSGTRFEVDPGSYLLFVSALGMEPQRMPVFVERGANTEAAVRLLPEGSTPPGFVWVPPGPTRFAGDPQAFRPATLREAELDGFFLARREVTNREYYEFLNDPEVRRRIAAAPPPIALVPRDSDGKQLAKLQEDGTWKWTAYKVESADAPVLGLSWKDVQQYLAWRNHRAEAAGEPWVYDLPSRDEWERSARGADGRFFPWGNRFDPGLTVNRYRKFDWLLDIDGGFERRDESPFGILDLGGSREEWTRDVASSTKVGDDLQRSYFKCGGHWQTGAEIVFRAASRKEAGETNASSPHGFRLLVRRR
ncbi:MAG TPA: SUMF1/EgtB/PvdO family nonheme iron enzyme, partial [Planctomycetota bacterium]|nr:SUMF1/EgtB/PvdO family nonheme iron enzyme [Planctomycetota bacterium]